MLVTITISTAASLTILVIIYFALKLISLHDNLMHKLIWICMPSWSVNKVAKSKFKPLEEYISAYLRSNFIVFRKQKIKMSKSGLSLIHYSFLFISRKLKIQYVNNYSLIHFFTFNLQSVWQAGREIEFGLRLIHLVEMLQSNKYDLSLYSLT